MAVKFNIPPQQPIKTLDIDNIQGLDSKNLVPDYNRAQSMNNIIKKDGLHQIRPAVIHVFNKSQED